MSSPVRLTGLTVFIAVIAVISLIYVIFVDRFIATGVRDVGSQLVGARVDLDSAQLQLGQEKLGLFGLAVTNPRAPMSNLLQADELSLSMDTEQLGWNKVIINSLNITGLQLNTPRTESGALDKHWAKPESWLPLDELPDLNSLSDKALPAAEQLLAEQPLKTPAAVEALKNDFQQTKTNLDQAFQDLPNEAIIKDYEQRFKAATKSQGGNKLLGLVSQGKELKQLREDVKKELAKIKDFKNQLQESRTRLSQSLKEVRNMPAEDLARLKSRYSLGGDGTQALINSLFGPQIAQWTAQGLEYYELVSPYLNKLPASEDSPAQASTVLTDRGRKVSFPDTNPLPDMLIKAANISAADASQHLSIAGNIANFSSQPERWAEPLTLDLTGTAGFLKSMQVKGTLDHRQADAGKDNLRINIQGLNLAQLPQMTEQQTTPMPYMPKAGMLDVSADVAVTNGDLKVNMALNFAGLQLDLISDSAWLVQAANALGKLQQFKVFIDIEGSLAAPKVSLRAPDLNKLAETVVKDALQDKLTAYEDQLAKAVTERTAGALGSLPNLEFLDSLTQQLDVKQLNLEQLLKL